MTEDKKVLLCDRIDSLIIRAMDFFLDEIEEDKEGNPFKYRAPVEQFRHMVELKDLVKKL